MRRVQLHIWAEQQPPGHPPRPSPVSAVVLALGVLVVLWWAVELVRALV